MYIKKVIPATRTEPPGIPLVPSSILEYSAAFNKLAKRSPIDLNPETQPQRDPADSERDKKEKETLEMINRFEKEVFLLLNPEGKAAMLSRFIEENMGKTAQT